RKRREGKWLACLPLMRSVRIAATAIGDLHDIWSHVAQNDAEAASRLVKEIMRRFSLLRNNPLLGRQQDQLLVNLRSFTVKGYLIFYQPSEDHVDILRVLHGSRDVEAIFERFFDAL
ncbi:MAG: type II toxin-antitoxin system RelE/ParE family toxin, partial [Acidobacteriota bacterium]